MESRSHPDRVHGMLIANLSLMKSLISVLPLEALQALLPALERECEFAKGYLLSQQISDESLDAFDVQADLFLTVVRDQLKQKEAMHTPDGALQWMQERLRPSDDD